MRSVPIVIILAVVFYLHRRNVKRQRLEDAKDPHRDLDFGIEDGVVPGAGKKKKKGRASMLMSSEKAHKTNQLSMDMNLESPYLLPPQTHGSQESVLTRGYRNEYDPYRMVKDECAGSIHSRDQGGSSKRASIITGRSIPTSKMPPHRQGSFPRTPFSPDSETPQTPSEKSDPFATPPATLPNHGAERPELQEPIVPVRPVVPEIGTVPYPDNDSSNHAVTMPDAQEPPIGMAQGGYDDPHVHPQDASGLGLNVDFPQPGQASSTPDNRRSKESDYGYEDYYPQIQTSEFYEANDDYSRGRSEQKDMPMAYEEQPQQGLGVPQQENKRLSVGFRPLPPDDALESEDPEYRANRIRSFYKEYFDDSAPAPPMPSVPGDYYGASDYYEDYDDQYLQDAAYFDPETNAFVMPGAQPVHRRAMTPPPTNRRGPPGSGPRGPPGGRRGPRPHGPHGSVGGMSLGGRPRAGSAWGSRAASSLGPRPDSSASARGGRRTPRKNLPPPSTLNTLPTPSKLRDDSFAIFNAADFAPPESFGNRARGRSQSPLGERRPYSPQVPAASPLVTSYDELGALPSP